MFCPDVLLRGCAAHLGQYVVEALVASLRFPLVAADPAGHQVQHRRLEMDGPALGIAGLRHESGLSSTLRCLETACRLRSYRSASDAPSRRRRRAGRPCLGGSGRRGRRRRGRAGAAMAVLFLNWIVERRRRPRACVVNRPVEPRPGRVTVKPRRAPAGRRLRPRRAEATRFIEPDRMSPTAKMPGTVVARFSGGSPSRHASAGTSRPVSTKPLVVARDLAGAASRSAGRRRAGGTGRRPRVACVPRCRCSRPRSTPDAPSPPPSTTAVQPSTVIRGLNAISPIRYDDMVARQVGAADQDGDASGRTAPGGSPPARRSCRRRPRPRRPLHLPRGGHRGAVVDAVADQVVDRLDAEAAVGDAGGDHHGAGPDVAALGAHDVRCAVVRRPRDRSPASR